MPLVTRVKVGSITNLSEARYCAGMGVDFLGFPCGSRLTLDAFREIAGWVSGPEFVLEFADEADDAGKVQELTDAMAVNLVELHTEQFFRLQPDLGAVKVILKLAPLQWRGIASRLGALHEKIAAIHLAPAQPSDWRIAREIAYQFPVLADPKLFEDLPAQATGTGIGIALSGGEEISPGLKHYEHLAEVLEKLEAD